jgi:hypothetical protein
MIGSPAHQVVEPVCQPNAFPVAGIL